MKILNLSLDKSILDKNSSLARRVIEYGNLVGGYIVVVPGRDYREIRLSEKVFAYDSGGSNKIFQLINIYRTAKKLLKQEKFDVITAQDQYYLALIGWFLARRFKIGLELQIHGFEKYSGLRKIIAKFITPRAVAIRCVSQRLKRQLISDFGIREDKITVAPIFVNLKNKISNLKSEKFKKDKFVFLTVGRLVPIKNISLQIKAMAKLAKGDSPLAEEVELWIVGDGPEKENLIRVADEQGVKDNIKFFGRRENVDDFYANADAFLLTSNSEGWGMVVVEAATHGLPIIMTDVGLAGEIIKNGESGIVIPVGNQAKLEEAMIRIIGDEDLRRRLAEGAQSAIEKMPSKEETLALYKKSWEKAMKMLEFRS